MRARREPSARRTARTRSRSSCRATAWSAADGSLTGFAGGVETKAWLLDHERRVWSSRSSSDESARAVGGSDAVLGASDLLAPESSLVAARCALRSLRWALSGEALFVVLLRWQQRSDRLGLDAAAASPSRRASTCRRWLPTPAPRRRRWPRASARTDTDAVLVDQRRDHRLRDLPRTACRRCRPASSMQSARHASESTTPRRCRSPFIRPFVRPTRIASTSSRRRRSVSASSRTPAMRLTASAWSSGRLGEHLRQFVVGDGEEGAIEERERGDVRLGRVRGIHGLHIRSASRGCHPRWPDIRGFEPAVACSDQSS